MPQIVHPSGGMLDLAPLALFGLIPMILWLIIAWRAMRAHERIADALSDLAKQQSGSVPAKSLLPR